MTELKVASIPMLNMLQKACETLVMSNMTNMPFVAHEGDRTALQTETQLADEMVSHIIKLLREINQDNDINNVSWTGV